MLQDEVVPWVKKATGNKGITFQQDGVFSHAARMVFWSRTGAKTISNPFGPKISGHYFSQI